MPFDPIPSVRLTRLRAPEGLGELARLAWPVVLARLGIMAMGLSDAVVVGRFSAVQLAWHALAWAPTNIILTAGVSLMFGVQVMTARRWGEGRPELAGPVLRRGIAYALAAGLASAAAVAIAGPLFLHGIGLAPGLADGATPPLQLFCLSLPVYLVACVCTFFLEGLGRPMPGMIAMWIANAVNLAVDLWLVPGRSGLPVDGAVAAAWATFAARVVLAVALLVYIARLPEARALGLFGPAKGDKAGAREQVHIGLGAGAATFIEMCAFSGMTLIMGRLGGLEAAAWSIALNVAAIVFMAPLGLSTATGVLVGRAFGARDAKNVLRAGVLGLGLTAALTLLISVAVFLGAGAIANAYTTDHGLAAMSAGAIALSALFFIPDGLQVVASQALRARGDVWAPTAFHLMSYAVVMLPLGWILAEPLHWGVAGAVWAVIVASFLSGGLLTARFLGVGRRRQ
jgi:MATE family multidrug resistance protein